MTSVDVNKWISGEIEAFFDPPTTPPPVDADSNPGEETTTRPSIRKFSYSAIAAVVAAFALVVLASIVVSMRYPAGPSLETDAKSQPPESGKTSAPTEEVASSTPDAAAPTKVVPTAAPPILNQPAAHPNRQRAAFLSDVGIWYDQRPKAAPIPQRKPLPARRPLSRQWPRYSSRVQAESGEATRLMVDELRQRGVAVGTASESGYPK